MRTVTITRLFKREWLLPLSIGLLTAAAWLALLLTGPSVHAHAHHQHGAMQGSQVSALGMMTLFIASWTIMTLAMMLPSTVPILTAFNVVVGARRDRVMLVALVVAGYLVTWSSFGVVVYLARAALQRLWLAGEAPAYVTSGGLLLVAGCYQFTTLKHRCLEKCRSALSFVVEHWRGHAEHREAFRLGLHHGLFCVGCCWALMLLMFVVGTANLGWMVILGVLMAVEKNMAWGRRLSAPLGMALIVWGAILLGRMS